MHHVIDFEQVTFENRLRNFELSNISFSISESEIIAIIGPENSGKEMVFDLLSAQKKPTKGTIKILGTSINHLNEYQLENIRTCIGYISSNYGLVNNLSVLGNIMLPLSYHTRLTEIEMQNRAYQLIERYQLEDCANKRPQILTASEKLRTAFCRALISQPLVILFDNALDRQCPLALSNFLETAFDDLKKTRTIAMFACYQYQAIRAYTSRYMLYYRGKLVFDGDKESFESMQNDFVRQYILNSNEGPMMQFHHLR